MSTLVVTSSLSDGSEHVKELVLSVENALEIEAAELTSEFRALVRGILLSGSGSWSPSETMRSQHPYLCDQNRFLDALASCYTVVLQDGELSFGLDESAVESHGFNPEIGNLMEYGSPDFCPLRHFFIAVEQWTKDRSTQFLSKIVARTNQLL